MGLSQTMLLVRLLKIDPLYFKPTDHPFAGILSAQFDVISLVIDRFGKFGNIVRARTAAEESSKRSVSNVMILPIARVKGPSRLRRVADLEPRNAVIEAEIYRLRVWCLTTGMLGRWHSSSLPWLQWAWRKE